MLLLTVHRNTYLNVLYTYFSRAKMNIRSEREGIIFLTNEHLKHFQLNYDEFVLP